MPKLKNQNATFFGDFQTLCRNGNLKYLKVCTEQSQDAKESFWFFFRKKRKQQKDNNNAQGCSELQIQVAVTSDQRIATHFTLAFFISLKSGPFVFISATQEELRPSAQPSFCRSSWNNFSLPKITPHRFYCCCSSQFPATEPKMK